MHSKKNLINEFIDNKKILITGGAGFIGGALIRKLLTEFNSELLNIDKLGYSSDLTSIQLITNKSKKNNYKHINLDLNNFEKLKDIIFNFQPDLIMHLAAESHVDRSIDNSRVFIESNIIGTFNLLEASRIYFRELKDQKKENFKLHHISTDEVFGSLDHNGKFSEESSYDPRSPYSASKASSDHLVRAWHHTYQLPIIITNCSNNFGPWQYPEKLIPLVIHKAVSKERIPIYGDGENIRDWLYVDDHVDALLRVISIGEIGKSYCIGGNNEISNKVLVKKICFILNEIKPSTYDYLDLIEYVKDRPGHDKRYAIDASYIKKELGWEPKYNFDESLKTTIKWYLENDAWRRKVLNRSGYKAERLGNLSD